MIIEVSEEFVHSFERIKHKLDTLSGKHVQNTNDSIVIGGEDRMPDSALVIPDISIHLTSAVSGQPGRYNAKIMTSTYNPAATGNLTGSDFGTDAASENAIFWNEAEVDLGISGGALDLTDASQCYYTGRIRQLDSTSGFPIFIGRIEPAENCS